jgi:uncharacterized SAM-binding protein YcdF (DUF218 family)
MQASQITPQSPLSRWIGSIVQGLAVALGLFAILNVVGGGIASQFNANIWWIDLRPLPWLAGNVLSVAAGMALLLAGLCRVGARVRWWITAVLAVVASIAAFNALLFYALLWRGQISTRWPVPLSVLVVAGLALVIRTLWTKPLAAPPFKTRAFWLTLAACPFVFPLAQMLFFGYTDYRRPADAIVVFGARTYATGIASQALADRVNTACDLYRRGLAPVLVFSGGPGDGAVSEPQAMRDLAISRGIPPERIVLDYTGFNTHATVDHVAELARAKGYRSVMAVSHFYHLPRVKLAFDRAGIDAYTVPAHETRPLVQMPKLIAREVPALWEYYLAPLAG